MWKNDIKRFQFVSLDEQHKMINQAMTSQNANVDTNFNVLQTGKDQSPKVQDL